MSFVCLKRGVRIKRAEFRENVRAFLRGKENCPYEAGVCKARSDYSLWQARFGVKLGTKSLHDFCFCVFTEEGRIPGCSDPCHGHKSILRHLIITWKPWAMVRLKERTLPEAYFNTGPNGKNSYLIDTMRVETRSMNIEATDSNILNFQVL